MATIYFIVQFCAASIQERRLLNSVLSVKYLVIVRALRKASFIRLTKNCDAVTWGWSKPSSLISRRFASKRYLHGTSNPFPCFLPMSSHDDCPPLLKKCQTSLDSMHSCTYRVYSFDICHSRHEVCSPAHVLLDYYLRLVFESGNYFIQHVRRCGDNSRAATNRERCLIEQIRHIFIETKKWG